MIKTLKSKMKTGLNVFRIFLISHGEKENNYKYRNTEWNRKSKVVVYTSITADYDALWPVSKLDGVDCVAYMDGVKGNNAKDGWKIYNTPKSVKKLGDSIVQNRYIKFHPFNYFEQEYDYAIYVDGNIEIIGDIRKLLLGINKKTGLAFHRHQRRDSVYKEIKACKILKKGNIKKLNEQGLKYKKEGFPENFGLYECNVIAVDLHSKEARGIMDAWWNEFLRSDSMRDQIALPYVVWKLGYRFDDIGDLGDNVYRNPLIAVKGHMVK